MLGDECVEPRENIPVDGEASHLLFACHVHSHGIYNMILKVSIVIHIDMP